MIKEKENMKAKYTKKQIQESIEHWQKVLESMDSADHAATELTQLIDDCKNKKEKIILALEDSNNDFCAIDLDTLAGVSTRHVKSIEDGNEYVVIGMTSGSSLWPSKAEFEDSIQEI